MFLVSATCGCAILKTVNCLWRKKGTLMSYFGAPLDGWIFGPNVRRHSFYWPSELQAICHHTSLLMKRWPSQHSIHCSDWIIDGSTS